MAFPTIEFKIELLRHGITQRQLAAHFRVHFSLVAQVINNFCGSPIADRMQRMLTDMRLGKFKRLEDY